MKWDDFEIYDSEQACLWPIDYGTTRMGCPKAKVIKCDIRGVFTRDGHEQLFSNAHWCAYPHIGANLQYSRIYARIFAFVVFSCTRMAIPSTYRGGNMMWVRRKSSNSLGWSRSDKKHLVWKFGTCSGRRNKVSNISNGNSLIAKLVQRADEDEEGGMK